jgi:ubiquinone/menaquinone biosynthesis C-methylase UbiE
MKAADLDFYVSPASGRLLTLEASNTNVDGEVLEGRLVAGLGDQYLIARGVPDLTYPPTLSGPDQLAREFYDARGPAYDANLHLTFEMHGDDEWQVRGEFIDLLRLTPSSRVLEVSCGTGRDSRLIADRLDDTGQLCLQDIARGMLDRSRDRLAGVSVPVSYSVSNACYLPYANGYFDAVYSFGGIGEFSDIRRSLSEMVRVSKVGARIVIGDESLPPWLRDTEFAAILATTNKQFLARLPLEDIPVAARAVCVRWVIGGVFYLIDFTVGDGEPTADFDFEIPGPRGGTYRTRHLGQLEGVTSETKALAERAAERSGHSMHRWLDDVVRSAAEEQIDGVDETDQRGQ